MCDDPGERAMRVMTAGLDLNAIIRKSVAANRPLVISMGYDKKVCSMPKWQQVELYLGLYERSTWSAEISAIDDITERALWYVAREMSLFHRNVIDKEKNTCQGSSSA